MSKQAPRFAMECSACGNRRELGRKLCGPCDTQKRADIRRVERQDPAVLATVAAYKRSRRSKAAEMQCRKDFVPHSMRPVLVDAKALLREADRIVAQVTATNRKAESDAHKDSPDYGALQAAKSRARYAQTRPYQVAKVQKYRLDHPEKKEEWDETRKLRIESTSDGTATGRDIKAAKFEATHCHYCGVSFTGVIRKNTDHVTPLCLGGAHSMSNIVIACEACNMSKASLTVKEWLNRRTSA